MQVPLLKRRLAGLRAKRFEYQGGEMTVDLSDTDLSSNELDGSWVVLKAKGLTRSLGTIDDFDQVFDVMGADGYGADFRLKGQKLILELSASSVG